MNPYDNAGAARPKNTAALGYAPPPVPVPGYFMGAANAGAQSAPKFAASTPYTSVQGAGSGGAGLNSWSVGMSSAQIGDILRAQGVRGPGADVLARFARRAGANGAPGDVSAYLATGLNRRDASAQNYLESLRATSQARQGAEYDANLDAYKAGLTKQYELAAPAALAGVDPRADAFARLRAERAKADADAARSGFDAQTAGIGVGKAGSDAAVRAIEAARERANYAAGAAAAPTVGYLPTGEQMHARSMVDHNATSTARAAGVSPSNTAGFYAERETARREADAAKLRKDEQALADAQAKASGRQGDLSRGAPVVSPDGKFFWNGDRWASVTSKEDMLAAIIAARNGQGAGEPKPEAGKPASFEAGKVYVQGGKRYRYDGKTFSPVQ